MVAEAAFERRAAEVLEAGGADVALHLRAPAASGRRLHALGLRLMEIARSTGSVLVINDRVDVAMAVGAHGVQLGRRGIAVDDARRILGGGARIGASVHTADEAREAVDAGADWLVAGAVYPTESHPGRPAAGLELIESIRVLGAPVIAIGGVTPGRVPAIRAAGAAGVAAIRGIWGDPSPGDAARRYRDAWQSWRPPPR